MSSLDKREKKGILIFAALSVLIIIIGIMMNLFDQVATGRVRSRHGAASVYFDGGVVIALGILLTGLGVILWLSGGIED